MHYHQLLYHHIKEKEAITISHTTTIPIHSHNEHMQTLQVMVVIHLIMVVIHLVMVVIHLIMLVIHLEMVVATIVEVIQVIIQ